jgi:type I restriction enzyme M protein
MKNNRQKDIAQTMFADDSRPSQLDIKSLESWLWEAACSIRGAVDAPKYKDFILPLIFVKRLSDVFEDEIKRLTGEFGSEQEAMEYLEKDHNLVRFYIPQKSLWSQVRKQTTAIGERMTEAIRAIAKANPSLQGVIDIVDYNQTISGQRTIDDGKLSALIEIISKHRLGLNDAEPDILGRAYEYLLRKFAEGQGQSAGEFYTPKEVGWIMAYILDPAQGQEVYDPCCGSGGLLVKCQLALKEKEKSIKKPLQLFGQEQNHVTYALAKMNMIIHDMEGDIRIGDTLRNPKFLDKSALQRFDLVVANPMWNQDGYDSGFYENDTFERFRFGVPPASSADWGWVQHMHASLGDKGRAAIVLDTGAVSRGSGNQGMNKEKEVRKAFVDNDIVETVLLLPENLFYNTTAPGIVLFLNKNKPKERKGKVMLINASQEFEKGRPKNFIPEEKIKRISEAFHKWMDIEKFTRIVRTEEVVKNDYNLSPSRYVETGTAEVYRPIPELLMEIAELEEEEKKNKRELNKIFTKMGYDPEARS